MIVRFFDIIISIILIIVLIPLLVIVSLIIILETKGPVVHWSKRIGKDEKIFFMPKFRSMIINTPDLPTHLMGNPLKYVTRSGHYIRKFSIDELPQLYSIFKGDLTFIGPRPALYNQSDLMELRKLYGIEKMKPGLTGYAQIMGRDSLSIEQKVFFEKEYLEKKNFFLNLKIIIFTFFKIVSITNIKH